jgi:hypothetical protein
MTNCRPISVLTAFSKVLKNFIYSSLSHYLQSSNILVPEEFSFRKGISNENTGFELTRNILESVN